MFEDNCNRRFEAMGLSSKEGIELSNGPALFAAYCPKVGALVFSLLLICVFSSSLGGAQSKPQDQSDFSVLFPSGSDAPETNTSDSASYPTWWGDAPKAFKGVPCEKPGNCVQCHEENRLMDPVHTFSCNKCHGGDPEAASKETAHKDLIADPGDLRTVMKTCGACHESESLAVPKSSMALAGRMINHTRFALGGQKSPVPTHATVDCDPLRQVPKRSESDNLGDDLLRRSCLRCHLYTTGSKRWGEQRGAGCSACHAAFPNSADGRPRLHGIIRNVGMTACLKCHNSNHVGCDYVGLFEKDSHRGFRSPFVKGVQAPTIYGSEQHGLARDIHFRAGMQCMDCHLLEEIHGNGKVSDSEKKRVVITCEGCHVTGDHEAVLKTEDGVFTLLKGSGRKIPRWDADIIPHSVKNHRDRLKCIACHAGWSFQDYGFHLMLEERADYWKWAPTAAQNDPQIQELLLKNVGTYAELVQPQTGPVHPKDESMWDKPSSKDLLTGEESPGAWFRGYTERKWSRPVLGNDGTGKISILRPMYQYVISHVDSEGNVLKNSVVPVTEKGFPALINNPYSPHTTAAKGRSCGDCHGDPKVMGLGEGLFDAQRKTFTPLQQPETKMAGRSIIWDALVDLSGNPLQFSTYSNAGPMDRETLEKLVNPSEEQKLLWHKYLKGRLRQP